MFSRFHKIIVSLIILLAVSCTGDVLNVSEPKLVIDGFIEDGGFPVVIVTTTIPVSRDFIGEENVKDCIVRWAKVTVSDGEHEVILTGKSNKGYFPPYLYTTADLRGEAGKEYSLTVEYHGMKATALTTIPESPVLKEMNVVESSGPESDYFLEASFDRGTGCGSHLGFFVREEGRGSQYRPSYLGLVDDDEPHTWNVYPPETDRWADFNPYFTSGMTIGVKLCSMDDASYDYWRSFADNSTFSGNFIIHSDGNMMSNVAGGEGIWAGYGVDTKIVTIP